jgi:UPF0755 protein
VSNIGLNFGAPDEPEEVAAAPEEEPAAPEHHRRARRRRAGHRHGLRGCLPFVLVLAVLAGALWFGGSYALDRIQDKFADAPDYPGPGTGQVTVEVKAGASSTAIGRTLKEAGVVESVEAFTDAARQNPDSRSIQVGFYTLKKEMKASEALEVLVDPDNLVQAMVTVPEGARVRDIVESIVKKTDIPRRAIVQALAHPKSIGLPPEADGNPEGYLYPATYTVPPKMTAVQLLSQMVAKTKAVEQELGVAQGAARLGLSAEDILIVASLLEHEANRAQDYPKVARVLYNRLDKGMALQLDSTVRYVSGRDGDVFTTDEERADESLYNTYKHAGLPPGPIGSPGQQTIKAALNPAQGDWLYFVTVNLETGETAFASSYAEHQRNVQKLREWCAESGSDAC